MGNQTKFLHRKNIIQFNKSNSFFKSILFITSIDYKKCEFINELKKLNVRLFLLNRHHCESFVSFTSAIKQSFADTAEKVIMIIFGCDHGSEKEPTIFFDNHHFHKRMKKKGYCNFYVFNIMQ